MTTKGENETGFDKDKRLSRRKKKLGKLGKNKAHVDGRN